VHVEAPDAEGHDGNALGKKVAIEAIDREILSRLIHYGNQPDLCLRILALPDHPTPATIKRHTRDLVPFALATVTADLAAVAAAAGTSAAASPRRMTEAQARATGLVVDPGFGLMRRLLSLSHRPLSCRLN
jgi:hypothetical protein